MSEWKEYKLGDLSVIQTIMPTNIGARLEIQRNNFSFIREKDTTRLQRYLVQEEDIVYSRRGDVEKMRLYNKRGKWLVVWYRLS